MYIENLGEIKAVAFDVDGTLYRSHSLTIRVLPYVLARSKFFLGYRKTRNFMHKKSEKSENFKEEQLQILANNLKCSLIDAEINLKTIIHDGLKKYFARLSPCTGVVSFIADLKAEGLKIGLLSDLSPEQKGDIWGIKKLCDVLLWSEDAGAIKPSPLPFKKLADELGVAPENILYVGNNHKYDILGAKAIGMKTAWIIYPLAAIFGKKSKDADITFSSYRQLRDKILNK